MKTAVFLGHPGGYPTAAKHSCRLLLVCKSLLCWRNTDVVLKVSTKFNSLSNIEWFSILLCLNIQQFICNKMIIKIKPHRKGFTNYLVNISYCSQSHFDIVV